jgi:alkyldihydroxyacetonephosphate synthase
MMDTLQTATTWSNLTGLYEAVVTAMRGVLCVTNGGSGYVMTHISHASEYGAVLCPTFLCYQVNDPDPLAKQAQWQAIQQTVTDAILAAGGTLAHNRGVGRDYASWLGEEVGPLGIDGLKALKQAFDPTGIMNPGILLSR